LWLNATLGENKIFYTTGRLTSAMVIKVSRMNIPVLFSRSGAMQLGLDIARQSVAPLICRAKGQLLLVLNNTEKIEFDAL